MKLGWLLGVAMSLALPLCAQATVIDFSGDATGPAGNGYSSGAAPGVHFSDSSGADLQVLDGGNQTHGNGLAVFGDDASRLIIDFDAMVDFLSLAFGNDDPGFSNPGDMAIMEIWNGASLLATVTVALNLDDIMNQSISFGGMAFDRAVFYYGNAALAPINLIEVVDDIEFRVAVPAPAGAALFALGLMLLRRRARV